MATQAELANIPVEFEFEGRIYKVARKIDFEMETYLSDWVYQTAVDRLERQWQLARAKGVGMSQDMYQRQSDRIADNLAMGKFDYDGEITQEAMNQLPGNKQATLLRFRKYDPSITMDLIERLFNSHDDARRLGRLLNPQPAAGEKQKSDSSATDAPAATNP